MSTQWIDDFNKIWNKMMNRRDSEFFREPVDWEALYLLDYPKIIKKPMDLGSVKDNLDNGLYKSAAEAAADVRLVFLNAMTYNDPTSKVYAHAKSLREYWENSWRSIAGYEDSDRPPSLDELTDFVEKCHRMSPEDLGEVLKILDKTSTNCLVKKPSSNEVDVNTDLMTGRAFKEVSQFVDKLIADIVDSSGMRGNRKLIENPSKRGQGRNRVGLQVYPDDIVRDDNVDLRSLDSKPNVKFDCIEKLTPTREYGAPDSIDDSLIQCLLHNEICQSSGSSNNLVNGANDDDDFNLLLGDIIFEEALHFTWLLRSGQMSLDEVYKLRPLPVDIPVSSPAPNSSMAVLKPKVDNKKQHQNWSLKTVTCQLCKEQVAGARYAPHLERCMNGGKRGTRKHYDALPNMLQYYSSKPKIKKEFVDPFPDSLVVRIKLRDGVPVGNSHRQGASLDEFTLIQDNLKNGEPFAGAKRSGNQNASKKKKKPRTASFSSRSRRNSFDSDLMDDIDEEFDEEGGNNDDDDGAG